jgi:hypothetical protein
VALWHSYELTLSPVSGWNFDGQLLDFNSNEVSVFREAFRNTPKVKELDGKTQHEAHVKREIAPAVGVCSRQGHDNRVGLCVKNNRQLARAAPRRLSVSYIIFRTYIQYYWVDFRQDFLFIIFVLILNNFLL